MSDVYMSPFSTKYGSDEMREIWSEHQKRTLWRTVWTALATVQCKAGLISKLELDDIQRHRFNVDITEALRLEKITKHDLMAELQVFTGQCTTGGGKLHLGATSADVEENADVIRIKQSLQKLQSDGYKLLNNHHVLITHENKQSLAEDLADITSFILDLRGKGIKGAVGTSASYIQLLKDKGLSWMQLEEDVMQILNIGAFKVTTQIAPRKQELKLVIMLSKLALTLQSTCYEDLVVPGEEYAKRMSSMMSIIRYVMGVFWDNAAHSLLERTLDDSANRREVLPVLFLAVDEMLRITEECL